MVIDPDEWERQQNDVTNARIVLGLSRNRFHGYDGGPGMPIVAKCVHCLRLFVSASHELADLDYICKGDCGCQKSEKR
jgi:hypothetical protein